MRISYPAYAAPLALVLCAIPLAAQGPGGNDINEAIPIHFGQKIEDIGDPSLAPNRVYKIVLARGQAIAATVTADKTACMRLRLLAPATTTIKSFSAAQQLGLSEACTGTGISFNYQTSVAGTYFLYLHFENNYNGINYTLQVNATGTPIAVPNPQSAGCLSGKVDSITYSLQYIAVGLPDEVTIGGTRACASCTTKPPLYPEISSRLETAMNSGGSVEACYDSAGNIFQLKLLRP
jgi:hypothetical protein